MNIPNDPDMDGADAARTIAPSGRLRAAINFGNPVLAQRKADRSPGGVSHALATELARRLGLPLDCVEFDAAGKVFDAIKEGAWDVAFLALDPLRSEQIAFSPPYVVIEGTYLVRSESPYQDTGAMDRAGVRIAVGKGAAYDLYLSRSLRSAQLVRAATSSAAVDLFLSDELDAAAGVRQPLEKAARENPALRVLPGSFTTILQAVGLPRTRSGGLLYLTRFIEEMKATGFVAEALRASGQADAQVAPANQM
jgi:polar amino acid transport system substrate-binding protein